MKLQKYNFKSLESLMSFNTITKPTASKEISLSTKNKNQSISQSTSNKENRNQRRGNLNQIHRSSSMNSLLNTSFETNEKKLEKELRLISKKNKFHLNFLSSKSGTKSKLLKSIQTLSTFINLNRIESTSMTVLSKGTTKEKSIISFHSNRIKEDCYYLKNKVPFLKDEVNQMQAELDAQKCETKMLNNTILLLHKDILHINDDIRKYNKLNQDQSISKENIRSTIDLLRKHIDRLKENIKCQNDMTRVLVHSASAISKTLLKNQIMLLSPPRKGFNKLESFKII